MMMPDTLPEELIARMPETDAERMEYVRFAVPAPLLKQSLELAKLEGVKPAEIHRSFWIKGFAAYAEESNKRMINQRLRKQAIADSSAADSEPPAET
jgi:hypothetical protein